MKTGLFVPCYIDAIYPAAAKSTYHLLERLGVDVEFIEQASCCALPEVDMGYTHNACVMEKNLVPHLLDKGYDYIVIPSGVCTDQMRFHLNEVEQTPEVVEMRNRCVDPVIFLHDVLKVKELPWKPKFPARVAIHNGCHSLRYLLEARPSELNIKPFDKMADLLALVDGLETGYATRRDECCGFGGTFCVWDVSCSGQQGMDKVNDYNRNGFKYVTSQDMSCLLHQSNVARKLGLDIKFYYITEILNGDARI